MPLSQEHVDENTPMGGRLVPGGGATFRVWAPHARSVHLIRDLDGSPDDSNRLVRQTDGRWTGFLPGARSGDLYLFYVEGEGSAGPKRDPHACELTLEPAWPASRCRLLDPARYPWHDAGFRPAPFEDLVIYQLHVGCWWGPDRPRRTAKFLDAAQRVEYLADLGVNAVQLMPVVEFQTEFSMGYNGTDYFSPENDYEVSEPGELAAYLREVNGILARRGRPPLALDEVDGSTAQLKVLVDLCHLHGIAVLLDVVYNHAGGDFGDQSLYFFDRQPAGDQGRSLYFSDRGWAGGLVFAFAAPEVRQFLIDNAVYWLVELHMDGLRYDEVSVIDREDPSGWAGWRFCQDLAETVRWVKPEAFQNAEYWPVNPWVVRPRGEGGAGFDATQHDGLREAVRAAVRQASFGMLAPVDLGAIAAALTPAGFARPWQVVHCVENHDLVYQGREPRVPALADPSDHRSCYARGRSRVAVGLLLTAPGIPMLFMGQELLEDRQWHDSRSPDHLVGWDDFEEGDPTVTRFRGWVQELIRLRRRHPALRRGAVHAFHVDDGNRVLAFQRWIEAEGRDVVVVASLNDADFPAYRLGFPRAGEWAVALDSAPHDEEPGAVSNGGGVRADGGPLHGLPASAAIALPARSLLVFTREPALP